MLLRFHIFFPLFVSIAVCVCLNRLEQTCAVVTELTAVMMQFAEQSGFRFYAELKVHTRELTVFYWAITIHSCIRGVSRVSQVQRPAKQRPTSFT